jgi:3-hydroxybutyryl-CoA dehydrogenase
VAATENDLTIGIVGAGAMGRGIAQVAASGGLAVRLYDAQEGAAEAGREFVAQMLARQVEKGRLEEADAAAAKARIEVVAGLEALAGCQAVVEAVVEDLGVKHQVFQALEAVLDDDAVIASNTSSIRIASIAAACTRPGRIAGMHFFNPVPLMRLVEVIRAPQTGADVAELLSDIGRRMGRTPVVVKDGPGFLVNLGGRAFYTEALRILHEGVATPAQVDAVMRDCCNYRMGPFELMDLTGIDVNFPVSQIVFEGFFHERRLATSPPHQALFEAGRYGRKSGAGWYDYGADGKALEGPSPDAASQAAPAPFVALLGDDREGALAELLAASGAEIRPDDGEIPLLAAPLGEDASAFAARTGADHRRLLAVDTSVPADKRITIMAPPGGDPGLTAALLARLALSGAKLTLIKDSPGFIAQRIRAMVANLGCEMAQIGIASPADIDTAMTLGLNYPQGPLALADAMGPDSVMTILGRLQDLTGDDRYRPSSWLRRRAQLGLPASQPD